MTEREYLQNEKARIAEWLDRAIGVFTHKTIVDDYRYVRLNEIIERIRVLDTPRVEIVTEEVE